MHPTPTTTRAVMIALFSAVMLVGCGLEQDPTGYGEINTQNDGYYGNFMFGCTGVEANEDGEYVGGNLETPEFCTCVFRGLVQQNVPFSDMQKLEEQQAELEEGDSFTLPPNIAEISETCAKDSASYA